MNREKVISDLKHLLDTNTSLYSYEKESLEYAILELERTAQEVPVQEQSNKPHILRIQNNTLMLDNFILKSVTSYKLSNDASKGISEININLIVNSSKIDF